MDDSGHDKALPLSLMDRWYNAPRYDPQNPWLDFDPKRAALILVDLINWQVDADGGSIRSIRAAGLEQGADHLVARCEEMVLPNLRKLIPAAREAGIQIVHARLASRHPDYRDMVPAMRSYARAADAQDGSVACEVLPSIGGMDPRDLSVVKTASGAFTGTDLDFLLRRLEIDTLLHVGVVTDACVLLSVAGGYDLGYRQFLITDCTATLSEKRQTQVEEIIGYYMAQLVTSQQLIDALG